MKNSLVLLLAIPLQAFAWGGVGHRAVGLIAEANLNPRAREEVAKLLGTQSLADVANWADEVRSKGEYPATVWYHFEKIPDGGTYLNNLRIMPDWQKKKGGIVAAILFANEILRDNRAPASAKTDALKFLVHFVGDIHQPLHTGRPDDNGGNSIDVTWFGTPMSLHRIWDSAMLMSRRLDAAGYADFLINQFSGRPVPDSMDVEGWLNESLTLRPAAYEEIVHTDQVRYQALHLPEVDLRIYTSGKRLARILNEIYTGVPPSGLERALWSDIERIVGDLKRLISFAP